MPLAPPPSRRRRLAGGSRGRGSWTRNATLRGLVCLALLIGIGQRAEAREHPEHPEHESGSRAAPAMSATVFERLARAWQAEEADTVAGLIKPTGTARFTLLAYPMSGKTRSMKPAQARVSLKAYFRKISGVRLKDVTPRGSPASVRLYEYRYRPARENQRKTRLQVQLKKDRKGSWRLASVTEST